MKIIAAPAPTTQVAAAPLSSVAPVTTSSASTSRNLGHQRVRRTRTRRAVLRRAGLPAGGAIRAALPPEHCWPVSVSLPRPHGHHLVVLMLMMHRVIRKGTSGCKPYVNEMQKLWRLCGEKADGSLMPIRQLEVGLGGL